MRVRLLYFNECPSWHQAAAHLDTLTREFDNLEIELELVDTPDKAITANFQGSPSILVDNRDLFAAGHTEVGLSCRIYHTPTGPAGCPTLDQIRTALKAQLGRS